jgi:hypothetical protein
VDKSEAIVYNLFSKLFVRGEFGVRFPLFKPVLIGLRKHSFALGASE